MRTADKAAAPEHSLERLIFFSDAVFAIAITLLIIEIKVPHLHYEATDRDFLIALAQLTPNFFGFIVSFWVIGAFWAGHHRAFGLAAHHSDRLVAANLALLFLVVFMPFATAFMSANIGHTVPTALYNGTMVITGLLNIRLVRMATSPPVVAESISPETIAHVRSRGWAVVLGALCALVFSFVDARFSQMALITIPVWQRLFRATTARRFATA